MKDYNAATLFDFGVLSWWQNLNALVSEIKTRGKKPVFVAISRKMPRLIYWFSEKLSQSTDGTDILKDSELITELALPFIAVNNNAENMEFVILDDLIVHGTTLRSVYKTIKALFDCNVHVCCIFRHFKANVADFISTSDLSKIISLSQEDVDVISDKISEIVRDNQLPIDMEFPIFTLGYPISYLIDDTDGINLDSDEVKEIDFSLRGENKVGANVDFCKVRFFNKSDKTVFEVYSPLTIAEIDLLSMDKPLFGDSTYTDIWERLTRKLRISLNPEYGKSVFMSSISLMENCMRSLAVIANYLYSLSAYSLNIDAILPLKFRDSAVLNKEDLSLLIGRDVANDIYDALKMALRLNEAAVSKRERYFNVPTSFAPNNFQNEMDGLKIGASVAARSTKEAFDLVFNYMHYTNPKFDNPYIAYERLFFGETHQSLRDVVKGFSDPDSIERDVEKWVNYSIDNGYIVPKYEKVKSAEGGIFWRRFFHAGIRRKRNSEKNTVGR